MLLVLNTVDVVTTIGAVAFTIFVCLALLVLFAALVVKIFGVKVISVFETHRGLLYRGGRFQRVLMPGRHYYSQWLSTVVFVDMRAGTITLPSQDLVALNGSPTRVAAVCEYVVRDPEKSISVSQSLEQHLAAQLQLATKDIVTSTSAAQLISEQASLSQQLYQKLLPHAALAGIEITTVDFTELYVAEREHY